MNNDTLSRAGYVHQRRNEHHERDAAASRGRTLRTKYGELGHSCRQWLVSYILLIAP